MTKNEISKKENYMVQNQTCQEYIEKTKDFCNQLKSKYESCNQPLHSDDDDIKNKPLLRKRRADNDKKEIAHSSFSKTYSTLKKTDKEEPIPNDIQLENINARFNGNFDMFSKFPKLAPKCIQCHKPENNHIYIACPKCKHWMHIECFVDLVISQRKRNMKLKCPECDEDYFLE